MKRFLFAFKVYYLVYVLLAFNAFVNEKKYMEWATYLLALWGMAAAAAIVLKYKEYKDMYNIWLIIGMIMSYVLSSLLSFRYGVKENIKEIVWMICFMFVLYSSCHTYTVKEMNKEFSVLAAIWIAYCSVVNTVSISMVTWGRSYGLYRPENGQMVEYKVVGFNWGRLWGMYDDPNHGAAIAVAAILLALYLLFTIKNRYIKPLLVISMVIQFLYIVLSDSRTGMVMLGAAGFLWTFVLLYRRLRTQEKGMIKRTFLSIVTGLLVACLLCGGTYFSKQGYNIIEKKVEASQKKNNPASTPNKGGQVGRKSDIEGNVSNGRVEIWKSGLEIAGTSPVFGVSFRNIIAYTEDHVPDTYLINTASGFKYDSLHNSVMDVLVSQGLLGILLLAALAGNTIRLMKRKLCAVRQEDWHFAACSFITAAVMAVGSMFLTMVFYLNAPQTYIFWLCLGYFVEILRRGEERG